MANDLAECQATIMLGEAMIKCSLVEHEGQHYALGMDTWNQPTHELLLQRRRRVAYRLAWFDADDLSQELTI